MDGEERVLAPYPLWTSALPDKHRSSGWNVCLDVIGDSFLMHRPSYRCSVSCHPSFYFSVGVNTVWMWITLQCVCAVCILICVPFPLLGYKILEVWDGGLHAETLDTGLPHDGEEPELWGSAFGSSNSVPRTWTSYFIFSCFIFLVCEWEYQCIYKVTVISTSHVTLEHYLAQSLWLVNVS